MNSVVLGGRAVAHHVLDAGAVVPGAVEQHDLAAGRQVLDVALEVPLPPLALRRHREGDDAGTTGVEVLGEALDRPPLPAASRPSNRMTIFCSLSLTQACSFSSSICSRRFCFSYSLRDIFSL